MPALKGFSAERSYSFVKRFSRAKDQLNPWLLRLRSSLPGTRTGQAKVTWSHNNTVCMCTRDAPISSFLAPEPLPIFTKNPEPIFVLSPNNSAAPDLSRSRF